MPRTINFPSRLLRGVSMRAYPMPTTRSAGISLGGREQIISADNALWQVEITRPRVFDRRDVRDWEAHITELRGRMNIARFPICDPYKYGSKRSPRQEPFSDDTWFTDGTGFVSGDGDVHPIALTQDADAGANAIYVDMELPTRPRLEPGDLFSINDHPYRVVGSTQSGWVGFEPSLRFAAATGQVLQTAPAYFKGRLSRDDAGQFGREFHRWLSGGSLTFVEAF